MIYLDNAATSNPKPPSVINAVTKSMKELSANPGRSGHSDSEKAAIEVYNCRKKIYEFFKGPSEDKVIFTPNCTHSLNYAIKGNLSEDCHIITSSLEHNAVMRPLYMLSKVGVDVDVAEVIFDDLDATFRSFKNLIKKNTKMIVCTHASNVTGHIMPIKEIGALCKQNGIIFIVDAAQTAGIVNIEMNDFNIDYLCIAPHKGLYAPMGTGILITNQNIPQTIIQGGTGSMSISYDQPEDLPERLESGTINTPGIAGISAGIDFINQKGRENIYINELKLMAYLYDELTQIPTVKLYTSRPQLNCHAPVLSFNVRGLPSVKTAAILNKSNIAVRAGLHCAPSAHKRIGTLDIGTVRVCPSVFTSSKDIRELIICLEKIDFAQKYEYDY